MVAPLTPLDGYLGFLTLTLNFFALPVTAVVVYLILVDLAKACFFKFYR